MRRKPVRARSARQMNLGITAPHSNRDLFTDHYLNSDDRLKSTPEWTSAEGLEEAFQAILSEYEQRAAKFTSKTNESQTEDHFIKPVLGHLGWSYEPQQPIPRCDKTPDYALLLSEQDWERIQPLKGKPELWQAVAAVGDAKRWELDLDKKRDGETPTTQITNYLYRSNVRWGILTNGRHWRLYERDKSRAGGIYYDVDLVELLHRRRLEDFKYFYLFFRKAAYVELDGQTFLGRVLQGSAKYATEVGDSVRESVYDALRHLMNGFLDYAGNGLDRHDAPTLKSVHDHSLILLYRLIFVLYAEDAMLLPCHEEPYRRYSLGELSTRINDTLRGGKVYLPSAATLWHDVLNLFKLIDTGHYVNGECRIPAYNGGLFSSERFPVIAYTPQEGVRRWDIGDAALAQAIDTVAYQRDNWDKPGTKLVDYATLGVRHLGTIYEGLLELRPAVAPEEMIEQPGASGKSPLVKPRREVGRPKKLGRQEPRRFAEGEVYLATDRGERKATGSYFTPEPIVNYIVDHTVTPLADEAAKQTAKIRQQVEALEKKRKRARSPRTIRALVRELRELRAQWPEPYLSLRIVDPAMGSGHFLVGAVDVISFAMATDPNLPPVPKEAEDDPQGYYKRLVASHCLFGVDLNWLAVELAKLSLWLHTVQKDKALDFLDHHLRCGNSLIGARIEEELSSAPPGPGATGKPAQPGGAQLVLGFWQAFSGKHLQGFLGTIRRIEEEPGVSAEKQRQKAGWFLEMERERDRYRQVANCWLAPYFGAEVTADNYQRAVSALQTAGNSRGWRALLHEKWFQDAYALGGNIRAEAQREEWRSRTEAALAERDDQPEPRCFFHWELEFPEIFFTPQGWKPDHQRGFDAAIGNPPWGAEPHLAILKRMGALHVADEDSSEVFVVRGLELTAERRTQGYVLPDTVLSPAKADLRRWCLSRHTLLEALNLGPDWFTADVRMSAVVWRCRRGRTDKADDYVIRTAVLAAQLRRRAIRGEITIGDAVRRSGGTTSVNDSLQHPTVAINLFRNDRDREILRVIRDRSTTLAALCDRGRGVELNKAGLVILCPACLTWDAPPRKTKDGAYGEKTCHHCAARYRMDDRTVSRVIVADRPSGDGNWHPFIDGDAITRYGLVTAKYIDTSAHGVNYKPQHLYEGAKIMIRQAGVGINAVLDPTGAYCPQSVYIYRVKPFFRSRGYDEALIIACLLSRAFSFVVFKEFGEIDSARAFAKLTHSRLENMPIPLMSDAALAGGPVQELRENASRLSRQGAPAGQDLDWRVERAVAKLWGLREDDVDHMIREFAKVHVNEYLLSLFPGGLEGNETAIKDLWLGRR